MSRRNLKIIENAEFTARFVEACGSSQPVNVARLLNISYQAAKNYLHGRLPDSNVLLLIADRTPYSLHWLLTGKGEKYADLERREGLPAASDQMRAFVRRECLEVIGEVLAGKEVFAEKRDSAQPKVIVLSPENIKAEKTIDEPIAFPEKRS